MIDSRSCVMILKIFPICQRTVSVCADVFFRLPM
jgi:hypothetical protein